MTASPAPRAGGPPARRLVLLGVLAGVVALAAGVWAWWPRSARVEPPAPDLTGADPEVAERIAQARREVLADRRSARAWGRLGMVLRAHDFGEEANACFAQAERLDPNEPRWPYLRGLTLVLTNPEEGIACLERAAERCEGRPGPRLRLAEVLLEQGRLAEAERHLKGALGRAPGHARARLGLARLAFARGEWRAGLGHLEACRDDPHARKLACTLRAGTFHRLGEVDRSARELSRARELPDDVPWPDEFVEEVEGLQVGVRARLARADGLARRGRAGEAVGLLEEVVRDRPGDAEGWLALGQTLLLKARDPAGAERALAEAVRLSPGGVEAWFHLGVARFLLGNPRGAAGAFAEVVRLKPDHTLGHYNLGLCLKDLGDRPGAERHLRRALDCQPDYGPAREALRGLSRGGGAP